MHGLLPHIEIVYKNTCLIAINLNMPGDIELLHRDQHRAGDILVEKNELTLSI